MFYYKSSTVNWCETDFTHNDFIIEYYNTLSSLFITLIGLYGVNKRLYFTNIYKILIFVGIFSAYFHMTLSFLGQILDELSITFIMLVVIYEFYKDDISNNHIKISYFLVLFQIIIQFIFPSINRFALFLYGIIVINKFKKIIKTGGVDILVYWCLTIISLFLAILFWISDFIFCDTIDLHFHALWHILIGITSFLAIECYTIYYIFIATRTKYIKI